MGSLELSPAARRRAELEGRRRARLWLAILKQPARAVACAECRAPLGSPCKRPSGYTIPGGGVHAARARDAARAAAGPGIPKLEDRPHG